MPCEPPQLTYRLPPPPRRASSARVERRCWCRGPAAGPPLLVGPVQEDGPGRRRDGDDSERASDLWIPTPPVGGRGRRGSRVETGWPEALLGTYPRAPVSGSSGSSGFSVSASPSPSCSLLNTDSCPRSSSSSSASDSADFSSWAG